MKPFLGINITNDKNNEILNGEEFITRTVSKETYDKYEEHQNALSETIEKARQPLWLIIVMYVCGVFALLVAAGTAKAGVSTAMENAPLLIAAGLICGVVWLIIFISSRHKEKTVLEEEGAEKQAAKVDENLAQIYSELGVPESAPCVDIIFFRYKEKDGDIQPESFGFSNTPYINLDARAYSSDGQLHIADVEHVYSFDIATMKAIKTVNKRISLPMWNKDEGPKDGRYKRYKITMNDMEEVFLKPYHILELEHNGEDVGIYFPCYELEIFEALTGLKAEK